MLFVEGHSEFQAISQFVGNWLEKNLPSGPRVGVIPVNLKGVGNYQREIGAKVERTLEGNRAQFAFGLVDLYGLDDVIDLSKCVTVEDKITASRNHFEKKIPPNYRKRFRQHFAIHELEAWLLAYPNEWPEVIREQLRKIKKPEKVNFQEPPAKLLKRLLKRRYRKTVFASKIFPRVDPNVAYQKCPNLRAMLDEILEVATRLQ